MWKFEGFAGVTPKSEITSHALDCWLHKIAHVQQIELDEDSWSSSSSSE